MQTLVRKLEELTAPLGGRVGVAARDLRSGEQVMLHADEPYPLASVFKVPVMVEVLRQVDAGEARLDERIELREADKSPGGILLHLHDGLSLTVLDLLYLMITQSDNIATDLLWRRIGTDSVNRTMRKLGLDIDCYVPDREYFLLEVGACPSWRGLRAEEIVRRVQAARAAGRLAELFAAVLDEARDLDGAGFQQLYDERFGLDGSADFEHAFVIDQALDNTGSPAAMAELLCMIVGGRCATAESCRLMERIMLRQEWRQRIPAGLPAGLHVANKTGSVAGTVNDAAIVRRADGSELVLVVFARGLDQQASDQAESVIASIAAAVWRRLG